MLTNDFFKFSSARLPKESLVKMPINIIFKTTIEIKNDGEPFSRNKGIMMEDKEVAIIQEKIIVFKFPE